MLLDQASSILKVVDDQTSHEHYEHHLSIYNLCTFSVAHEGIPDFLRAQQEQEGGNKLKRFMIMMDSMTDKELDGEGGLDLMREPSRIWRIAKGAGAHPQEVVMLLRCHKQFEDVVKKMGKANLLNDAAVNQQIARNPQQVRKHPHATPTVIV